MTTLTFTVADSTAADTTASATVTVEVREVFNFGYAGRNQAEVAEHVREMSALGLPAPARTPAIFPLPPDRITTASTVVVSGADSYGEVEFALINTEERGWIVTIASDHTDLEVERVAMPKAKGICPDVVGPQAWALADIADTWDNCVLRMWTGPETGEPILMQEGTVGHLLSPHQIIDILQQRRGRGTLPTGTVILSGTIAGEPTPGSTHWSAELEDPGRGRRLRIDYDLLPLPTEL